MGEVSKGEGRTVLFVSHNMSAVKELCSKGILLKNGVVKQNADITSVVSSYFEENKTRASYFSNGSTKHKHGGYFKEIKLYNGEGDNTNVFSGGTTAFLEISYVVLADYNNFNVGMVLTDMYGTHIYSSADTDLNPDLLVKKPCGHYTVKAPLPLYNLNTGNYSLRLLMGIMNTELFDATELSFSIENKNFINTGVRPGLLISLNKWEYNLIVLHDT